MVNDAILSGLRNAMDRGEDAETAMRTMTASGYDRFEVNEAAKAILKERSDAELHQAEEKSNIIQIQKAPGPSKPRTQTLPAQQQENRRNFLIGAMIMLLLVAAGLIYFIMAKFK